MKQSYDFVIIGAGSAGCVLANRLTACGRYQVLLIESGGAARSPALHVPAALRYAIGNPRYDWCYITEPDESCNGREFMWHRGRVLGGSSAINGQIFVRGQRQDFDGWAALGNPGWSYDELLPFFRSMETFEGGANHWRGGDGPQTVSYVRTPHRLSHVFVEAAVQCGIPHNPDYNGADQAGAALLQATQRHGARCSAATAFLAPARRRANLTVMTNMTVQNITIAGNRASGVTLRQKGKILHVAAEHEVILSAGSIASPQLLMLSGIGPADHLRQMGINVRLDAKGVGHNLQEHPGLWTKRYVNERTFNMDAGPWGHLKHGTRWLLRRDGPAATPGGQALAFITVMPGEKSPDIELHFTPNGYKFERGKLLLYERASVSIGISLNRPRSRGQISLRSAEAEDPPVIRHQMLSDDYDVATIVAGARRAQEIFAAPAFKPFLDGDDGEPGGAYMDDDSWIAYARATAFPYYHPSGTCKMGPSTDPTAVVDARLKLHGLAGLRVVDASIMPTVTSGNTAAPVMMIAEKAAAMILEEARC